MVAYFSVPGLSARLVSLKDLCVLLSVDPGGTKRHGNAQQTHGRRKRKSPATLSGGGGGRSDRNRRERATGRAGRRKQNPPAMHTTSTRPRGESSAEGKQFKCSERHRPSHSRPPGMRRSERGACRDSPVRFHLRSTPASHSHSALLTHESQHCTAVSNALSLECMQSALCAVV